MAKIESIAPATFVEDEDMGYGEDVDNLTSVMGGGETIVINEDPDGLNETEVDGGDITEEEVMEFVEVDGEMVEAGGLVADNMDVPFGANLAEYVTEDEMLKLADTLMQSYDMDVNSRSDWEETYQAGLELLGLKIENRTEPWDGAFGAHHPMLAEAVVKFQSETIIETFPAQGPAKTKIIGDSTPDREQAATRVREDMNHMLTDVMTEYRPEHERLLWSLPICGSAFKKIFFDPTTAKPTTQFVPAEDFVVSYGATDLESAERYTHRMKKTENEVRKLQVSGFYRDIELADATIDSDALEDEKNEFTGLDASEDSRRPLLEMHCDINLVGFEDVSVDSVEQTRVELPYVVTIDKSSGEILAIYRNWREEDTTKQKRIHFSHYTYVPGFGFYGFGLIHLIGGFTKGATAILRQLVDAGTLSNLPGGYKTRGMKVVGGDTPVAPGEFRDTDVATGTLKENIMPLPFKEPSVVLYELLKNVVEEGRRFAAVSDVNIADMTPNAPVGSTLAILERTLKTMTAIQARVHYAMKHELSILKTIAAEMAPVDYAYDAVGETGQAARKQDYSTVEIIPVSDPNASSMSQRIVQYQAALQLMQMNPKIYDEPRLHREMLEILGIKNAAMLVPDKTQVPLMDPVTENMALLTGVPVKAVQHQNHEAHIAVHTAFVKDPKIIELIKQQGPAAMAKADAAAAHVNEHYAYAYRSQIEQIMGQQLPPVDGKPLDPQVENQLSQATAQAAQMLGQKNQQEAQQKQQQEEAKDPLNVIQREELKLKAADQKLKEKTQADDHKIDQATVLTKAAQAEWQDAQAQKALEVKVMDIMDKGKFSRDSKKADGMMSEARDAVQERASQRQADTAKEQTEANERNSQRQARSSAMAAAAAKRSDKATQQPEKKE